MPGICFKIAKGWVFSRHKTVCEMIRAVRGLQNTIKSACFWLGERGGEGRGGGERKEGKKEGQTAIQKNPLPSFAKMVARIWRWS